MGENIESLEESLLQYELQLQQVTEAISANSESSDELNSLRENLVELITLTKENLLSVKAENEDPLAKEYELFKAELESEQTNEEEETDSKDNIQDELGCLVGKKCQAPFCEQWSGSDSFTHHNALIMNIDASDSLDNIPVKVMFVNPTCKEMLPCQYFLEGECKFSDENCHFSHGYVVNFSDLREYKEPDFNLLKENVSVLVKDTDCIWKRAIVTALILEENQCSVKFESGRAQEKVVDIKDTLPLGDRVNEVSDSDNAEFAQQIENSEKKDLDFEERQAMLVEKSLLQPPPPTKLGEWEKYTKNIGSKLMANMGYVVGTGLGKHGEGRVEPVSAVVLPPGKSLDHCMALREAAGGDPNLFSVDKLQKKLRKRVIAKNRKVVVQPKKSKDVFSFINDSLLASSPKAPKAKTDGNLLKQSSTQSLNVEELRISENMQKKNYELMVLREKLSRHKVNTVGHNELAKKVRQIEDDLNGMQCQLKNVHQEQSYRQTMKQLTEF